MSADPSDMEVASTSTLALRLCGLNDCDINSRLRYPPHQSTAAADAELDPRCPSWARQIVVAFVIGSLAGPEEFGYLGDH